MTALIKRSFMEHRPQEIGKIKLGGRGRQRQTSGGSTSYIPEKYDHFEVVTRARAGGTGAFERDVEVHRVVGEQPRELEGILMFPEVEQNLMTKMAHYSGRKPTIVCDGEVQTNAQGKRSPCSRQIGESCPCRPYARLQLQLVASPYTGGYYVFRTRSWESVNNIQTALEEMYLRFGSLFMAPVKLMCYESEDLYTQDGQDKVGRSWKVALVLNMPYERAALHMVESKERLEAMKERLMLTAGQVQEDLDEADEREAGELADEFDPPKGVEASVRTQEALEVVVEGLAPVGEPEPPPDEPAEESGDAPEEPEEPEQPEYTPPQPDPAELEHYRLRHEVTEARAECRNRKLLDKRAEAIIQKALDDDDEAALTKALAALHRKLRASPAAESDADG